MRRLERSRVNAAVDQEILAGDIARLGAAQIGAQLAELLGRSEPAGGNRLFQLPFDFLHGLAFEFLGRLRGVFEAPQQASVEFSIVRRSEILSAGKLLKLVETGNHAQGCIFRDGGHLRTDALERVVDNISRKLPGFYIGRYDVRYENEEEFKAGRNFQIVELNGASSEATSIYDARNSLISAYRTLFRQWKLVFAIGAANRARGCSPAALRTLWREWRQYSVAAVSYPCAS